MTDKEQDLLQECDEILNDDSGPYQTAKQLTIEHYRRTGGVDERTLIDFRSVLNSVGDFLYDLNNGDFSDAESELDEIRSDLEETACVASRRTAEAFLEDVERKRARSDFLYRILLENVPNLDNEIGEINNILEQGDRKNPVRWQQAVSHYKSASAKAENLNSEVPDKYRVRRAVFAAVTAVVGLVGSASGVVLFLYLSFSSMLVKTDNSDIIGLSIQQTVLSRFE